MSVSCRFKRSVFCTDGSKRGRRTEAAPPQRPNGQIWILKRRCRGTKNTSSLRRSSSGPVSGSFQEQKIKRIENELQYVEQTEKRSLKANGSQTDPMSFGGNTDRAPASGSSRCFSTGNSRRSRHLLQRFGPLMNFIKDVSDGWLDS